MVRGSPTAAGPRRLPRGVLVQRSPTRPCATRTARIVGVIDISIETTASVVVRRRAAAAEPARQRARGGRPRRGRAGPGPRGAARATRHDLPAVDVRLHGDPARTARGPAAGPSAPARSTDRRREDARGADRVAAAVGAGRRAGRAARCSSCGSAPCSRPTRTTSASCAWWPRSISQAMDRVSRPARPSATCPRRCSAAC